MLEVVDIRKRFGEVEALAGCSFSVERGRGLGFLGPNGAGKLRNWKLRAGGAADYSLRWQSGSAVVELKSRAGVAVSGWRGRLRVARDQLGEHEGNGDGKG